MICATSTYDAQILIRFALLPAVLELHAILRQMHQTDPNMTSNTKTLKATIYPMCMLQLSAGANCNQFALPTFVFELQAATSAPNDTKMTINAKGTEVPHILVATTNDP